MGGSFVRCSPVRDVCGGSLAFLRGEEGVKGGERERRRREEHQQHETDIVIFRWLVGIVQYVNSRALLR